MKVKRREFIKISAAAAGILLSGKTSYALGTKADSKKQLHYTLPKHTLGKTGQQVSIIGLGGLVLKNAEHGQAVKCVEDSLKLGINYFDVAPTYGDAELKLGEALKPYRDEIFLACKTSRRDRAGAQKELNRSLKRLQTEHIDLYQLHAIRKVEKDVKAALGKNGAIETFLDARRQGIIRYIGFSAHSAEAALTAMSQFDFDTIMYPVNFACHFNSGFETQVLGEAKKRNLGIIGIKALAKQKLKNKQDRQQYPKCWYEPIDEPKLALKALSWSLAQDIAVSIPPGEEILYRLALKIVPECQQPSGKDFAELKKIAAQCNPIFSK